MTEHSTTPINPLKKLLATLTPCRSIAVIVALGVVAELLLLTRVSSNIYTEGERVAWIGPPLILWFWLTLGWCLWGACRMARSLLIRLPRALSYGVGAMLILTFIGLIFVYLGSWGLYLRSGRFSNIESLMFAAENATNGVLTQYFLQAEKLMLWGVGAILLILLVTLPILLRRIAVSEWEPSPRGFSRVLIWGCLSVAIWGLPYQSVYANPNERGMRKVLWLDWIKNRVNPAITLGSSYLDFLTEGPIERAIDENELTPLDKPYEVPPLKPGEESPSIIFVAIESLRPDVLHQVHQGKEITPVMNRLAKNSIEFTRAYSQSTHSDYADVCIVSSLYPLRSRRHHYYTKDDPWPRALIYDMLKKHRNYTTAIISSQNEAWGRMDRFLESPHLDLFYDAERSGIKTSHATTDTGLAKAIENGEIRAGKLVDTHTADVALDWVTKQVKEDKPYFLSMNLQSSHFPYEMPEDVPRPFQPCTIDFDASFLTYPREKTHIVRNAYYNAIQHCDRQVGRLVERLRELGTLDDTILVVMGENGEAFNENGGYVTHAREPVEPMLRVACILHAPKYVKPSKNDYPVELIDMVPTVLSLMGWPKCESHQGIDILSEERPKLEDRLMFFHTENGLTRADAVIQGGRWKILHNRNSGLVGLFDLQQDPTESTNLFEQDPERGKRLFTLLRNWRQRQLAYYHYPSYYRHYHPPGVDSLSK